jgi:hypothetical protein
MNKYLTIGMISIAALTLALSSVVANQVWAVDLDNPGKGHERQTDCDHGPEGQGCPGKSEDADGHFECETITAGKSGNVKDSDCP